MKELIKEVAEKTGYSEDLVSFVVDEFWLSIRKILSKGYNHFVEGIRLKNFGKFYFNYYKIIHKAEAVRKTQGNPGYGYEELMTILKRLDKYKNKNGKKRKNNNE